MGNKWNAKYEVSAYLVNKFVQLLKEMKHLIAKIILRQYLWGPK